jgi:hypothetical protein
VFRTTACAFVSSITTAGTARPVHVLTRVSVIRKKNCFDNITYENELTQSE